MVRYARDLHAFVRADTGLRHTKASNYLVANINNSQYQAHRDVGSHNAQ